MKSILPSPFFLPSMQSKMCISLSKRPGRFGMAVHNAGYHALGLDYLYKAFAIQDIAGAISGVRAMGIRGCSISMPFKESVMNYLDSIDSVAAAIGAVNTVVNDDGHLRGFNTDRAGAVEVLKPHLKTAAERILVLGGGGVARAILQALKILGQKNVIFCVRVTPKYQEMAKQFQVKLIDWSLRQNVESNVIINETSIGMHPNDSELPIDIDRLRSLRLVMDVIASPTETRLIKMAKEQNLNVIAGHTLALYQAYEQFSLYTGFDAPREEMRQAAETLL